MLWIAIIIIITVAINALYVAAEFATVSARRSSIQQLAGEGHQTAKALLPILEDGQKLDRYVASCQIGITLSSIILGAFGQAALTLKITPLAERWFEISEDAAFSFTAGAVLITLTSFQMILGELVPKSISLQFPNKIALLTYLPMRWSMVVFSWFIAFLNGSGVALLKLIGVRQSPHRHIHSPSELEILLAESRDGGELEPDEHERLKKALRLTSKKASEILVPRTRIVAIDVAASQDQILQQISAGPYTRFPVFQDSLDNIIGMLHAKDVVSAYVMDERLPSIMELLRPLPIVSPTVTADRVLVKLRKRKSHQAVVIDEHGDVEGIITLSDVLTEVMGPVGDEFKLGHRSSERLSAPRTNETIHD